MTAEPSQITKKLPKKRRAQYDKVGKLVYLSRRVDRVDRTLKEIKVILRRMDKGLEHHMMYESEDIQDIACRDEVDRQILEELRFAGEYGMLPRDIAAKLGDKRFTRFYVTARLKQMNKKLDALLGKHVAEKRGKNWALTSFMRSAWDSTKEELQANEV